MKGRDTVHHKLNLRKTVLFLNIINAIQIISALAAFAYILTDRMPAAGIKGAGGLIVFMLFLILSIALNSALAIKYTGVLSQSLRYFDTINDNNNQLQRLNNTLRAQRHDFMNQLQVVYSLMEMGDFEDAREYIEKIYCDIQKVNRILKTSNSAVNALLQAKIINAEKKGINVHLNITTQLKDLNIEAWELCRVLSNLIDNSIFELELNEGEKHLWIKLSENLKSYRFVVGNNGREIPETISDKIFDSGFSTKGDKGEGMGLYITKEILEAHGGYIEVRSSKQETFFECWLPKAHDNAS
ncbi:MAG: sensor histidine kinase [Bacillota bacterium]